MGRVSNQTLIYNGLDTIVTRAVKDKVWPEVLEQNYLDTYNTTIDLYQPLMYMMIRGIKVNTERLAEVKKKVEIQMIQTQEKINKICGRPLNPNSPKDCAAYFYIEKGIPPYTKRNAKGSSSITCDDTAMSRIAKGTANRKGYYEATLIQRWRRLAKLKGTYLDITLDKDSRLRCSYNARGTKFGRLSSSKTIFDTGMNMQNLPQEFTAFLEADEDKIFWEVDKSGAEWVVVAYDSGDASMISCIEQGIDPHAYTASQMFNVPIDIIKMEDKIIGHTNDPDEVARKRKSMDFFQPYLDGRWLPRTMSIRQCGKKSNHGLNYDETFKMFAMINEITEKEAKVIVDFYHKIYPGIGKWYDRIQSHLGQNRTLYNLFGRPCRFLDRWGPDLFKPAYSYIPQSTVGELVNRGLIRIYNDHRPEMSSVELLQQIHDSIRGQIAYKNPQIMARALINIYKHLDPELETGGRTFKIKNDLKIGFNGANLKPIPVLYNENDQADALRDALHELKATK